MGFQANFDGSSLELEPTGGVVHSTRKGLCHQQDRRFFSLALVVTKQVKNIINRAGTIVTMSDS